MADRYAEDGNIIQYRCYVKDQLQLEDPPKSFMRVISFEVKRDLLTSANSTITVYNIEGNVNNGDVLVLYDDTGKTIYQGVIKSMTENKITCSQMQSIYKGNWIYHTSPNKTSLEREIKTLMDEYAEGKMYKASYVDPLVAKRLGGITVLYKDGMSAKLPTDLDKDGNENYTVKDMETWIYSLYEQYGIMFSFEINFSGKNYVTIKEADYDTLKISDNTYAIKDISPVTTIEETNRLYIYSKDKVFRKTYVATTNNKILANPASNIAVRFNVTNTKFVFSDDELADLVAANLPNTMYNHKLTFSLILKNFIYQFEDFKLGMPLDVWIGEDYYNTVLTGYEISKNDKDNVTEVKMICGLVRTALTKMLTLGKV